MQARLSNDEFTARRAAIDTLRKVLIEAQAQRDQRQEVVDGEIGWVIFEREQIHAAANRLRAAHGQPPLDITAVERVENFASGHIDYTAKFALYVADEVFDIDITGEAVRDRAARQAAAAAASTTASV